MRTSRDWWSWVAKGMLIACCGVMLARSVREAGLILSDELRLQVRAMVINDAYLRDW